MMVSETSEWEGIIFRPNRQASAGEINSIFEGRPCEVAKENDPK